MKVMEVKGDKEIISNQGQCQVFLNIYITLCLISINYEQKNFILLDNCFYSSIILYFMKRVRIQFRKYSECLMNLVQYHKIIIMKY